MEAMPASCCGIDIHKESVVACLRLQEGRRGKTELRQFGTTTAELLRLHEWLSQAACTHAGGVHARRDGVNERVLAARLQSARGELRRGAGQCAPHQSRAWPEDGREGLRVDRESPRAWSHPRELHPAAATCAI
jgi:hypothetical protein